MNNTLVMKFGGASVATPAHFSRIAERIVCRKEFYPRLIVVVSAMGNTTDELISLAHQVSTSPPQRELDMLISVGERVSISLLAMALAERGCHAVSFTGSQTGIITCTEHTDAKIVDVRPNRLLPHLERGSVVIDAGFQGVSKSVGGECEITTLGRGGSDTTAVALAAALGADCVEYYKDVDGIYDRHPKKYADARHLPHLSYTDALELTEADHSAAVLHPRCIRMAQHNGVPLHVRSFESSSAAQSLQTTVSDGRQRKKNPCYEEQC